MDEAASLHTVEHSGIGYTWVGLTDPGVVRDHNEDAVYPSGARRGDAGVVGVADGLGGHPGGEAASQLVIDTVASFQGGDPVDLVAAARQRLVEYIMIETEERPDLIAMATTLTFAVLRPAGSVAVGHVGDSRLYVMHDAVLRQITKDHTIAMERIRSGELTAAEAEDDPSWHVISNWIGFERNYVETHVISVETGDTLLLCTDGLSNMVDDPQIEQILGDPGSLEERAKRLIDAANEAGGVDNSSVVVVDVNTR